MLKLFKRVIALCVAMGCLLNVSSAIAEENLLNITDLRTCYKGARYVDFSGRLQISIGREISEAQKNILRKVVNDLYACGVLFVAIEGHADQTETPKKSFQNSKIRAEMVKEVLVEYGFPEERISTVRKGEENPPFSSNPQDIKNRTVVFKILAIDESNQSLQKIILGTATPGGTYYRVGNEIAKTWRYALPDSGFNISVEAISTNGSVNNVSLLQDKEITIAIMETTIAMDAIDGKGTFKDNPYKKLRAIATLWPDVHHFILSKKFVETSSLDDLDRNDIDFCVGNKGSGTVESTTKFLDILGKTRLNRIVAPPKPESDYNKIAEQLIEGNYDGASFSGGIPLEVVETLIEKYSGKFVILNFTLEQVEKIIESNNNLIERTIKPEDYVGLNDDESVITIATPNVLVVDADLDENIVYLLTKEFFANLAGLKTNENAKALLGFFPENAFLGMGEIPLHPGAFRYYHEQGQEIPEENLPPQ